MTAASGCFDRGIWKAMLDERVPAEEQPALFAHLEACPACVATVAELSSHWSLATLAREGRVEGPATRAIRERLAARLPTAVAPQIPGLEGLTLAGQGGMGTVFRGHDPRLGRPVAVKVLSASGLLSASARARAEREARALASLDHPHIVRIHSAGDSDGLPYIVMEWIEGRSLQARIDAGSVPAREAARIALHLAEALAAVHAVGIVHRDLKPANVLLAAPVGPADAEVPKLVDFGLARPDDTGLTQTTAVLGTPSYMAPEQTGLEPALGGVTSGTDIHGLGAVLYGMLAGRPPYDAATAGESLRRAASAEAVPLAVAAPRTPPDLRTIVETCLRYEPSGRYESATALADDLARFLAYEPIAARPPGPLERLRSWTRRRPAAAVAALCGCLLVIGAAAGGALHVVRLQKANAEAMAGRDAAIAAQGLARQSLERLTDDSIEALLMRGPALGEEDRGFLDSVRDELLRWPLEPDRISSLEFRARGLQRIANLFRRLQRLPEALACQDLVLATLDSLGRDGAAGPSLTERRIAAQASRRQLLYDLGRLEEALAASCEMVTAVESLQDRSATGKARLADALLARAIAEDASGDVAAVSAIVDRGLGLFAEATASEPDNPVLLQEEARALYNAALLSLRGGRLDERRDRLERLVIRSEEGLRRLQEPAPALSHSLLLGLSGLAAMDLEAGRPQAAMAIARRRLQVARNAHDRTPDNPIFRAECIDSAIQLAVCEEAIGSLPEAITSIDEAIRLAEAALEREPALLDRALLLANALWQQALLLDRIQETRLAQEARARRRAVLLPWKDRPNVASMLAADGLSDQALAR